MQVFQGTPVMVQGRIVFVAGDLFKGKKKTEFNSNTPKIGKDGEQEIEYTFGLAVPKTVLNQTGEGQPGQFWAVMYQEAWKIFPNGQIPQQFAMKFKDGDTAVTDKGEKYSDREGYPGHIVLTCSTTIPPKFFKWDESLRTNVQVEDGIFCGDYVNVQLNIKPHPAMGNAKGGLYLNPYAVQFVGHGKRIINTPSGDQLFGNTMPPLPPGASATPAAPTQGFLVPQGVPQAPQHQPAPSFAQSQMAPPPVGYGQPPAPAPVTPNYNILPPQHQPQAQPSMPGLPPIPNGQAYPAAPGYPQGPVMPTMPQPPRY